MSVLNHLSISTLSLHLALPSMLCATWAPSSSETYSSEPKMLPWSLFIMLGVPWASNASPAHATTSRARMVSESLQDTM